MASAALRPGPTAAPDTRWNTAHLGLRLGADAAAAATAALLVAPVIAAIDQAIMENASGARSLAASLQQSVAALVRTPHRALLARPCRLIALLYGGTYLTANVLDTTAATLTGQSAGLVTAGAAKFGASSAANVSLTMYKDRVFVRLFGPPGVAPRAVPAASYAFFALRDCTTTFASFIVPPRLAPYLQQGLGQLPPGLSALSALSGQTMAQFAAPAAMQVLSAPLHLLGLDLYNRPSAVGEGPAIGLRDRWAAVCRNWGVTAAARIARIVPAYGVGGVVNLKVRGSLMGTIEASG